MQVRRRVLSTVCKCDIRSYYFLPKHQARHEQFVRFSIVWPNFACIKWLRKHAHPIILRWWVHDIAESMIPAELQWAGRKRKHPHETLGKNTRDCASYGLFKHFTGCFPNQYGKSKAYINQMGSDKADYHSIIALTQYELEWRLECTTYCTLLLLLSLM